MRVNEQVFETGTNTYDGHMVLSVFDRILCGTTKSNLAFKERTHFRFDFVN